MENNNLREATKLFNDMRGHTAHLWNWAKETNRRDVFQQMSMESLASMRASGIPPLVAAVILWAATPDEAKPDLLQAYGGRPEDLHFFNN
jgi:hypothetical protein